MDEQVNEHLVPKLTTWAKQLTEDGLELVLWAADPANGIEDPPTREWLANNPEAAANLWRRYQAAMRAKE